MADTKAAQANIQAQRASLADTEQNVLLAAVTSYADLVQNIAIADARRNNVLVLIQQLDATRERFRVGELTITDVSQAEARLEGARADLVQAEAQIRIAEAAFQRAIGQKPGRLGEIPLIGGLPISEDEAISLAMDFGPRAVSAQYRISAASYGVNSAVGDLLPQVNLVGVIQQQFDLQVPTDQYYTYGVRVQATVPIYQNGSEWSRVRQAKELVGQRRNELDSARRAQAENVIRAWRQLDSSRSRVTSFEAQVRANEVALNGVRQEALVGSRTTLDVLNAEQELLNSQVSLVQARHDVQVAYYGVLAGVGRLTARTLALPVEYYDEERYYNEVGLHAGSAGGPAIRASRRLRHRRHRRAGALGAIDERPQERQQRPVDGRHTGVHPQDHFRRRGARPGEQPAGGEPGRPTGRRAAGDGSESRPAGHDDVLMLTDLIEDTKPGAGDPSPASRCRGSIRCTPPTCRSPPSNRRGPSRRWSALRSPAPRHRRSPASTRPSRTACRRPLRPIRARPSAAAARPWKIW